MASGSTTKREMLAALDRNEWMWRVPAANLSPQLDVELKSAKWWAQDLTQYDARGPGMGMVGAVLSLKRHLLAIMGELKRLQA